MMGLLVNVNCVVFIARAFATTLGIACSVSTLCDASVEPMEPSFTTLMSASTASRSTSSDVAISEELTLSCAATSLTFTSGASNGSSAVELTVSSTVNVLVVSRRARRVVPVRGVMVQSSTAWAQRVFSKAAAMLSAVTPAGSVEEMSERTVRTTTMSADASSEVASPLAAVLSAWTRDAGVRRAAADSSTSIVDCAMYWTGGKGDGLEGGAVGGGERGGGGEGGSDGGGRDGGDEGGGYEGGNGSGVCGGTGDGGGGKGGGKGGGIGGADGGEQGGG